MMPKRAAHDRAPVLPGGVAPSELGGALQQLMALLGAASEGAWLRLMHKTGLTPAQLVTLHMLENGDAETVSRLADRLAITRGAVSHLVERLVRLHLVTREEAARDRRRKHLELTPAGRRLLGRLRQQRVNDFSHALERVSGEARAHLEGAIRRTTDELRRSMAPRVGPG
jgi:DNA-binding MarR family transcriptional regulator